jgi:hypothetical protein
MEPKSFPITTIEDFFGTRITAKCLCMIETALPEKEKIHIPFINRFGNRKTLLIM